MTATAPIASAGPSPPGEVTLATCIGCGALSLPGSCPGGCAQERRLELIPAAELDELSALTESAEAHAGALRAGVDGLARRRPRGGYAQEAAQASALLAADGRVDPRLRDLVAEPVEPVESWWCPSCGGVDAPQPCLGVCIRTPVRWANADQARQTQQRAAAILERTDELLAALFLVAHTRPQPGQEARHWDAVRQRARRALAVASAPADR